MDQAIDTLHADRHTYTGTPLELDAIRMRLKEIAGGIGGTGPRYRRLHRRRRSPPR